MGTVLAALIKGIVGAIFNSIISVFAALFSSLTIFRHGEKAEVAAETTEDLAVVQAERKADVDAPTTGNEVATRLENGDA